MRTESYNFPQKSSSESTAAVKRAATDPFYIGFPNYRQMSNNLSVAGTVPLNKWENPNTFADKTQISQLSRKLPNFAEALSLNLSLGYLG